MPKAVTPYQQNIYDAWRFAGQKYNIVAEASGLSRERIRQVVAEVIKKNEREDKTKLKV